MTEKKINFFLDTPKSLRYNTNTNNGDKNGKSSKSHAKAHSRPLPQIPTRR